MTIHFKKRFSHFSFVWTIGGIYFDNHCRKFFECDFIGIGNLADLKTDSEFSLGSRSISITDSEK